MAFVAAIAFVPIITFVGLKPLVSDTSVRMYVVIAEVLLLQFFFIIFVLGDRNNFGNRVEGEMETEKRADKKHDWS